MTTLDAIRTAAKQRADMVNSAFVTDAEWLTYINASYFALYGLLTEKFGDDYHAAIAEATTDGASERIELADDFFKLRGVDLKVDADRWVPLKPFTFAERSRFPLIPEAGLTLRIHYVPRLPPLVNGTDVVDGVNGWEDYIVVDAARKALVKEESDASELNAELLRVTARIEHEAANRDAGMPARVSDVYAAAYVPGANLRYRVNGADLWIRQGPTAPIGYPYGYGGPGEWWP